LQNEFQEIATIDLSPHLPYIYVPERQWAEIAEDIDSISDNVDCSWDGNYCRYAQSCDSISSLPNMPLKVWLTPQFKLEIDISQMLIPTPGYCYLPIFKSLQEDETWYMGAILLKKYAFVY
jgi:hypothetical protein